MKIKIWITGYLVILAMILGTAGLMVYNVDPFFHYHKPKTARYFYTINNPRSQNDGICKHFDYDALITGSSMTENFKSSDMDAIFGTKSIKVPFSGASYKEINDNLKVALKYNDSLKTIVRCLDIGRFFDSSDIMRFDLGVYPTYLYDDNPFNDVEYLLNKSVIFDRTYIMMKDSNTENFEAGITSFDDYANWQSACTFGIKTVLPNGIKVDAPKEESHLTDAEKEIIYSNIFDNVVSLTEEYPDVTFYLFFSPYSASFWAEKVNQGEIYRLIEAEQYIIEMLIKYDNIKLYSFNMRTDIITNLNNYKDALHYGEWINSLMLKWMYDGDYQLTKDNYMQYIKDELEFYTTFDYESINDQKDYESDFYAAALLNKELTGTEPLNLLDVQTDKFDLKKARIVEDQYQGNLGLLCTVDQCISDNEQDINSADDVGARIKVDGHYNYLVFYGRKMTDNGQPEVCVYDEEGVKITELTKDYQALDNEWHQYVLDVSKVRGNMIIVFNNGCKSNTGDLQSAFCFSGITLY